jgi:phage terminase large subunit
MITSVSVPANGWRPRPHQENLWRYLENGGKRAVAIWHRRAGKDEVALHHTAVSAMTRPASYWHCLPEYAQCRKAIWTAVNPHTGKRRIDEAFPHDIRENTNDNEMFIRFKGTGSTWQCIGSDSFSSAVGASTAGIVFSEYALANPSAWAYFRPMVEENDGWATFITTPRGRNHALSLFRYAEQQPGWFAELLTSEDTGTPSAAALAETLAEYSALYGRDMGRAQYEQEYMCSFNAAILGAFYALEMQDVRREGRIDAIEPIYDQPVHRAWDLGVKDDTSIWWFQSVGAQLFVLDHYAASGVGLEHFADLIEKRHSERGWLHGTDYVPHDAKIKEWGSGRTRVETMQGMGLRPLLVPMATVADGINAARRALPLCVFHPRTEETGIAALEQYRREWDDDKKTFRESAVHDWTSHPSDAFRYLALSWRPAPPRLIKPPKPNGFIIPPPEDMPRRQRWGA